MCGGGEDQILVAVFVVSMMERLLALHRTALALPLSKRTSVGTKKTCWSKPAKKKTRFCGVGRPV